MNLAIADVKVLARALVTFFENKETDLLEAYTDTVLRRVWRAQQFSYWMTTMMHRFPDATPFDLRRQVAELDAVTSTVAGSTYLAENYVGIPD